MSSRSSWCYITTTKECYHMNDVSTVSESAWSFSDRRYFGTSQGRRRPCLWVIVIDVCAMFVFSRASSGCSKFLPCIWRPMISIFGPLCIRDFEKGLADRGGWREEIHPMPEVEASFLHPFSYAPPGRRDTHFWTIFWPVLWGLLVANPLPPTPFRNLWLQKCVGDFCSYISGKFAGDFPWGYFWALSPTKMRTKNPATKSTEKSCGSKKNPRKIRFAKTGPTFSLVLPSIFSEFSAFSCGWLPQTPIL